MGNFKFDHVKQQIKDSKLQSKSMKNKSTNKNRDWKSKRRILSNYREGLTGSQCWWFANRSWWQASILAIQSQETVQFFASRRCFWLLFVILADHILNFSQRSTWSHPNKIRITSLARHPSILVYSDSCKWQIQWKVHPHLDHSGTISRLKWMPGGFSISIMKTEPYHHETKTQLYIGANYNDLTATSLRPHWNHV